MFLFFRRLEKQSPIHLKFPPLEERIMSLTKVTNFHCTHTWSHWTTLFPQTPHPASSFSGPSEYEDILQCNNAPSTRTPRGHQIPASFMIVTSGLVKHGLDSASPLPYVHLDIAGSSGPFPGVPTGAPIPTMAKYFMGLWRSRPSSIWRLVAL